ncbi:MAG: sodium-translocating pyrophosphatase [Thermogutta sp.]|nr:sodium-translocating pyrophosphatase [Thermogutta sp.]
MTCGFGAVASAEEAAAESVAPTGSSWWVFFPWVIALGGAIVGLFFAWRFFQEMLASEKGDSRMEEIAGYVREGANAYLYQQYKIVALFFVVIFVLLAIAAFGLHAQSTWVPFAFLTGGFFSGLAGWFGMKTATWASSRTAQGCRKSLNEGLRVAFRSGAVMGLTVVGLGLLDICLWFAILYWVVYWLGYQMSLEQITVTMLCFGMGASSQALFARVGGGIFTKAADVGADLVGKVEAGIPEDDPRNPAVIADNVGDNVGDVAGMGADLYESYCGSILATAALGVAAFATGDLLPASVLEKISAGSLSLDVARLNYQLSAMFLPMVLAGVGILLSILGIYAVRSDEDATQRTLLKALARGINLSTAGIVVVTFIFTFWLMPDFWTVSLSVITGLVAGWLIGKWTEYSTSDEYTPTKKLAEQALTGPATVIIGGIADGMKSTWFPVIVVSVATLLAFGFAAQGNFYDVTWFAMGLYGVGIAAVGMLSTLGITLATDAYGPIADNAGGNAEMSHLPPEVRQRTDALDSLGNTTAATGKGFAIGSAALTALALLAAYVEEVRVGFDRWAHSALVSAEPGLYKLSDRFVGEVGKEEDASGKPRIHGYLIFPSTVADPLIADEWKELDASQGPVPIPEGMLEEFTDKPKGIERQRLQFTKTKSPLVRIDRATMPDFANYYEAHLMNPKVLVGVLIGAMAAFLFSALTMKAVGRAAYRMVEEVRRQFREKPGIMEGTEKPDYAGPVRISTQAAQREMIVPSVLGLLTPVIVALLLGVAGVMGLLMGALSAGFCIAVFMANAGGSWDNAKKYIERGAFGGKGTDAHKAAVVGDTVGDPFKDTSGPSLNILIKLMSMVSVVAAGLAVRYSLAALGWF